MVPKLLPNKWVEPLLHRGEVHTVCRLGFEVLDLTGFKLLKKEVTVRREFKFVFLR